MLLLVLSGPLFGPNAMLQDEKGQERFGSFRMLAVRFYWQAGIARSVSNPNLQEPEPTVICPQSRRFGSAGNSQ